MSFEYNNSGKIFTDIISKTPLDVIVQTTTHLVQGTIHIRLEERLKDELDRDELFLALTDVNILDSAEKTLYTTDFIAIHRDQIVWVLPNEKEEATK
ncbi:MAG: hypothetical protein GY755_19225 [Chloroflexi bacterium]|nr:hypothetical protein [Chloroflexota bacterium]